MCITALTFVEKALEEQSSKDIDQRELVNCRIYGNESLIKLSSESTNGWSSTVPVPGKLFAVFMDLHLSALKLIQLLTDSSLRGRTHTHISTHTLLHNCVNYSNQIELIELFVTTLHQHVAADFSSGNYPQFVI